MELINENEYVDYDEDIFLHYIDDLESESLSDKWNNCVVLSILSVLPLISRQIVVNLIFGFLSSTGIISRDWIHFVGGIFGLYLLYSLSNFNYHLLAIFTTSIVLFLLSICLQKYVKSTHFLMITFITNLVICEYGLIEQTQWLQIRGVIMILYMKLISLAGEFDDKHSVPRPIEFFGYILSSANVLLGPWITFVEYMRFFEEPPKKSLISLVVLAQVLIVSFTFLTISNCWSEYVITDNQDRWLLAYREAFSFRTSHYFISYLAEAGMIAAGFSNSKPSANSWNKYRYHISQPLHIEFPSSLAEVIRRWNSPMHSFLKKYIYMSSLKHGKFIAILVTFIFSSLLHGFELKVSMVLINLGIFSYMQVAVRDRLAVIFDCCISIRRCNQCAHKYGRNSIRVKVLQLICTLLTVFHLAYLGVLMDTSTNEVGIIGKWKNLYFASHVLMVLYLIIVL